jgi:hypothetical protein
MRILLGSGRTPEWDKASKDYHATHKTCEMCGLSAGSLGKLDGKTGVQAQLECHDKNPYHKLADTQKNDYDFLMTNFICLHHFEHHRIAHAGDPSCLKYLPDIENVAASVLVAMKGVVD